MGEAPAEDRRRHVRHPELERGVGLQGHPTLTHDQQAAVIAQVTTNWDSNTARTLAAGNLAAAPAAAKGTAFILAPNDTTARAIADVFAADKDVRKAWVTGQDAEKASVQYIIDGKQGMTVFKDPRPRVHDAVAAAVAFLRAARRSRPRRSTTARSMSRPRSWRASRSPGTTSSRP